MIEIYFKHFRFEESDFLKSPSLSYSNKDEGLPIRDKLYENSYQLLILYFYTLVLHNDKNKKRNN